MMLVKCEYEGYVVEMHKDKRDTICVVMLDSKGNVFDDVTKESDMWLMPNQVVLNVNQYPQIDQVLMDVGIIQNAMIVDQREEMLENAVYEVTEEIYHKLERR